MSLNNIVDICDTLQNALKKDCKSLEFVNAYPSEIKDFPIKKPTVSVTIKSVELPYLEGMYLGVDTNNKTHYGITAECDIALNICVPKSMKGTDCYTAFNSVADSLLKMKDLLIKKVYCDVISYDRILGALVLKAGVKLSARLSSITD